MCKLMMIVGINFVVVMVVIVVIGDIFWFLMFDWFVSYFGLILWVCQFGDCGVIYGCILKQGNVIVRMMLIEVVWLVVLVLGLLCVFFFWIKDCKGFNVVVVVMVCKIVNLIWQLLIKEVFYRWVWFVFVVMKMCKFELCVGVVKVYGLVGFVCDYWIKEICY